MARNTKRGREDTIIGSKIGAEKARNKLKEKLGEDAQKIIGRKGGSVRSDAKKKAAVLRNQKRKEAREKDTDL